MIQEHYMLENLPTTSLPPIPVINIGTIEWMACNNDKYMETISRKPTIYCSLESIIFSRILRDYMCSTLQ